MQFSYYLKIAYTKSLKFSSQKAALRKQYKPISRKYYTVCCIAASLNFKSYE